MRINGTVVCGPEDEQPKKSQGESSMGEVADDIVEWLCCSHCGMYFVEEHGYPVLCKDCFKNKDRDDDTQKAQLEES